MMDKTADNTEKLEAVCVSAGRTIKQLRSHMDDFVRVFAEDRECWRGEAASEEQGFVDADKKYLDELTRDMEAWLDDRES